MRLEFWDENKAKEVVEYFHTNMSNPINLFGTDFLIWNVSCTSVPAGMSFVDVTLVQAT